MSKPWLDDDYSFPPIEGNGSSYWTGSNYTPPSYKKTYGYFRIKKKDNTTSLFYIQDKDMYQTIIDNQEEFQLTFSAPLKGDEKDALLDKNGKVIYVQANYNEFRTWSRSSRNVATCLYNATSDYMKHLFGMSLDHDDQDWYSNYDNKVDSNGCKGDWTLTVVQQLIEPYNLGIKKARVEPGSMRYAEQKTFILALGANPFFMRDGVTTNLEALAKLKVDPNSNHGKSLLEGWRFDCEKETLRPSIVLSQFQDSQIRSHSGGASYRGPRAGISGARISIQLDRLDSIKYVKPLQLSPYEEHEGTFSPYLGSYKVAEKELNDLIADWRKKNQPVYTPQRSLPIWSPPQSKTYSSSFTTSPGDYARTSNRQLSFSESPKTTFIESSRQDNDLEYPPSCPHCQSPIYEKLLIQGDNEMRCDRCNNKVEKNYRPFQSQTLENLLRSRQMIPHPAP